MFTERQWNQIRAALVFWNSVAESSRLHPMEHRSVRHLFEKLTPLTDREITALAESGPEDDTVGYPIGIFARDRGVRPTDVQRILRREGIRPACSAHTALYLREDLERVVDAMIAKQEAFRETYTLPPETESDPSERGSESIYPLWLRNQRGHR